MIAANSAWQLALLEPSKQPLYVFEIPDYGLLLASFSLLQTNMTVGGYGVAGYGAGGYGQ